MLSSNIKAQISNQTQSSNVKNLDFEFQLLICHLDFKIWILAYRFCEMHRG